MKITKTSKIEEHPKEIIDVICPFCKEKDFDLVGLKSHIINGDCEIFNKTPTIKRFINT